MGRLKPIERNPYLPTRKPSEPESVNSLFTIGIIGGVVLAFMPVGRRAEYLAGMTAGVGILSGLRLFSRYPNRVRIGTVTTVVLFSAVLLLLLSRVYAGS